jgi:hypothetical protein
LQKAREQYGAEVDRVLAEAEAIRKATPANITVRFVRPPRSTSIFDGPGIVGFSTSKILPKGGSWIFARPQSAFQLF